MRGSQDKNTKLLVAFSPLVYTVCSIFSCNDSVSSLLQKVRPDLLHRLLMLLYTAYVNYMHAQRGDEVNYMHALEESRMIDAHTMSIAR